MTNAEIVEKIKEATDKYMWASDIEAYIKGYLDALCNAYEITWDDRIEIENMLNETEEIEDEEEN